MDVGDELLHEPGVVTVALPGVVRKPEGVEAEPVCEAGRQHAGQVAQAARGEVEAAQPPAEAGVQGGQGPGLGVHPVQAGVVAQSQLLEVGGGLECVLLYRGQNFVITNVGTMNSLFIVIMFQELFFRLYKELKRIIIH